MSFIPEGGCLGYPGMNVVERRPGCPRSWQPMAFPCRMGDEVPRRLLPTHNSITTLIIMHCMFDINIRISWLGYQESPWLSRFSLLGAPYWPEVMNIYTYYQT